MSRFNSDLQAITRCAKQFRTERMAAHGLKGFHTGYLSRICNNPGVSQDQLAKNMLVDKSTVARQAAVLEDNGFITRTPSTKDKRVLQLYPTEKALNLLPEIRKTVEAWDAIASDGLTADELETLTQLLYRVRLNAAKWMEEK